MIPRWRITIRTLLAVALLVACGAVAWRHLWPQSVTQQIVDRKVQQRLLEQQIHSLESSSTPPFSLIVDKQVDYLNFVRESTHMVLETDPQRLTPAQHRVYRAELQRLRAYWSGKQYLAYTRRMLRAVRQPQAEPTYEALVDVIERRLTGEKPRRFVLGKPASSISITRKLDGEISDPWWVRREEF